MVAVIALVVGIGIGTLGGYLLFGSGETAGESATADVEIACQLAEHIADSHDSEDDWGGLDEDTAIWHSYALGGLLSAAAIEDDQYDQIAEAGIEVQTAVSRLELDRLTEEIEALTGTCAEL